MSQWFSGRNFKIVSFQIVSFSWLFPSSLVSRFLFCCGTGNRGCGLVQSHNFAYEKTSHLPGHIWASSVMGSSAEMCITNPYLFRSPSSLCLRATNTQWKFSCALHAHSQFVGTLANFDLVTLVCAIPLAWNESQYYHHIITLLLLVWPPSALNCSYLMRHSRSLMFVRLWTALS